MAGVVGFEPTVHGIKPVDIVVRIYRVLKTLDNNSYVSHFLLMCYEENHENCCQKCCQKISF